MAFEEKIVEDLRLLLLMDMGCMDGLEVQPFHFYAIWLVGFETRPVIKNNNKKCLVKNS